MAVGWVVGGLELAMVIGVFWVLVWTRVVPWFRGRHDRRKEKQDRREVKRVRRELGSEHMGLVAFGKIESLCRKAGHGDIRYCKLVRKEMIKQADLFDRWEEARFGKWVIGTDGEFENWMRENVDPETVRRWEEEKARFTGSLRDWPETWGQEARRLQDLTQSHYAMARSVQNLILEVERLSGKHGSVRVVSPSEVFDTKDLVEQQLWPRFLFWRDLAREFDSKAKEIVGHVDDVAMVEAWYEPDSDSDPVAGQAKWSRDMRHRVLVASWDSREIYGLRLKAG